MLSPFDIHPAVREVLLSASSSLASYQILERLPADLRDQIITERGMPGDGQGSDYTAVSFVTDAVESLLLSTDAPHRVYLEMGDISFEVAGQTIKPGNDAIAYYKLHRASAAPPIISALPLQAPEVPPVQTPHSKATTKRPVASRQPKTKKPPRVPTPEEIESKRATEEWQKKHPVLYTLQFSGCKEYFFGIKVCLIVTEGGQPVEFCLVPGSWHDIEGLRSMDLNVPDGSTLIGDSGFLDISFENALREEAGLELIVPRRKNMKEQLDACLAYVCRYTRKRVETTFSQLTERMARSVHAVTPRGIELKICLTILAFSLVG